MNNKIKNIDKIYVITLDTSVDRQNALKQRFPELMEDPLFEWYITKRDSSNPERGCWNSHKNVLGIAKQRNYSKIIIMEDDCDLLVPWSTFCDSINDLDYDSLGDSWTTISLGYFPILCKQSSKNGLVEILCAHGATGYIVNVKNVFVPEYNYDKTKVQIDQYLFCNSYTHCDIINNPLRQYSNNSTRYGTMPVLLRQRAKTSTINNIHDISGNLEIDRNLLVSLSTKTNTITFFTVVSVLLILLLILVLLFCVSYFKFFKYFFILMLSLFVTLTFIITCLVFFLMSIIFKIKYNL
jgi:hypothetical protein